MRVTLAQSHQNALSTLSLDLVDGQKVCIGRDGGCDIHLPDPRVSRVHCEIVPKGESIFLHNHSKNALMINNKKWLPKTQSSALRVGDTFSVIEYVFLVEATCTQPSPLGKRSKRTFTDTTAHEQSTTKRARRTSLLSNNATRSTTCPRVIPALLASEASLPMEGEADQMIAYSVSEEPDEIKDPHITIQSGDSVFQVGQIYKKQVGSAQVFTARTPTAPRPHVSTPSIMRKPNTPRTPGRRVSFAAVDKVLLTPMRQQAETAPILYTTPAKTTSPLRATDELPLLPRVPPDYRDDSEESSLDDSSNHSSSVDEEESSSVIQELPEEEESSSEDASLLFSSRRRKKSRRTDIVDAEMEADNMLIASTQSALEARQREKNISTVEDVAASGEEDWSLVLSEISSSGSDQSEEILELSSVSEEEETVMITPLYEEWNCSRLRATLSSRALDTSGHKAALISRLQEDDAQTLLPKPSVDYDSWGCFVLRRELKARRLNPQGRKKSLIKRLQENDLVRPNKPAVRSVTRRRSSSR